METEELREALAIVEPGLSSKEFVAAFRDFFFDGDTVSAYNGKFGLIAACHTDYVGSVRGDVLYAFLTHSRARQTEMSVTDSSITFTSGVSVLNLPFAAKAVSPVETFLSDAKPQTSITLHEAILKGFEQCLACTIDDPTLGDRMGVLIEATADHLSLFSTDSKTVSSFVIKQPTGVKTPTLFSVSCDFVGQILRLARKFKNTSSVLHVDANSVSVDVGEECIVLGSVRSVGQSIIDSFLNAIELHGNKVLHDPCAVPVGLMPALDRALSLVEPQTPLLTNCRLEDSCLYLTTKTRFGEIADRVKFPIDFPPVSFRVEVALLKRMLAEDSFIQFTQSLCIILRQGDFLHLIGLQPDELPVTKSLKKTTRQKALPE